jgi:excisionase family DNA binding protein
MPDVIISANPAGSAPRRAYTLPEACNTFSLSRNSVRRLIDNGSLPTIHIGRRMLILAEDIDGLLARAKAGEPIETAKKAAAAAPRPVSAKKPLPPRLKAHLDKLNAKAKR